MADSPFPSQIENRLAHVDHAGDEIIVDTPGRETELDGDSPIAFLGQAVAIGSGERLDQRCLAMIYVRNNGDISKIFIFQGFSHTFFLCL